MLVIGATVKLACLLKAAAHYSVIDCIWKMDGRLGPKSEVEEVKPAFFF